MLYLDLETRSQCDISRGVLNYAMHPSTSVICMAYAFDDETPRIWFAEDTPKFPSDVINYINSGGPITAHNAAFERHLFDFVLANDYDFDPPKLEQWQCSAARAMAHGLPSSLEKVCKALNLPIRKQTEGKRLIRDYSVLTEGELQREWKDDDKDRMASYCLMDVETMRAFCQLLRQLTPTEWRQYHITEAINDRGVPLDMPFVEAAIAYASDVRADVATSLKQLTDGAVSSATERKSRDLWLAEQLTPELLEVITVGDKIKFDKEHRRALAAEPDLPENVSQFIALIEDAGGATISKYNAMLSQNVAGRVHGSLIWNGAGATGRYSSRGLQLQNFRRDTFKDPEPLIEAVISHSPLEHPAEALGRLIRSAITHPDGLTFSDYSQIEARVLPWLSALPSSEAVLDIFRAGRDLYSENAVRMFNLTSYDDVTPDLRQAAKQGVLACGFGGGARAVQAMAKGYGLKYSFDEADRIKTAWREANPWASTFWFGLKNAMQDAIRNENTITEFGRIKFLYDGVDWLWLMLPSGRCLAYYQPKFELVEYPWGDMGWEVTCLWGSATPKAGAHRWPRRVLNHLILSENATQATAADIMRETIVRAHDEGLDVLFSVHDELVVQGSCLDALHTVMTYKPVWADGLPIDADTQESTRYGK